MKEFNTLPQETLLWLFDNDENTLQPLTDTNARYRELNGLMNEQERSFSRVLEDNEYISERFSKMMEERAEIQDEMEDIVAMEQWVNGFKFAMKFIGGDL